MGLKIGYPKSDGFFENPKSRDIPGISHLNSMKNPCGFSYHPAVRYIIHHPISSNKSDIPMNWGI